MNELSSDDSLDEFCSSYATFAKKTYEVAVERASKATIDEEKDTLLDSSSIDPEKEISVTNDITVESSSADSEKVETRQISSKRRSRTAKIKRKCESKDDEEDSIIISSGSEFEDSLIKKSDRSRVQPRSSTRKAKGQNRRQCHRKEVEKETVILVSSDEEIKSQEIRKRTCMESNELMSIKVCWKYCEPIQKFQLRRYQKFQSILEHFAKIEAVPVEQVVLYGGKDNLRSIEPYDTPDSIGYTITDILEGGILSKESVKQSGVAKRYRDPSATDGEEIELRVQLEQIRSFPLLIKKDQKMGILIVKVAEQLETEVSKVKLLLDGEVINLESTPQDLSLEDGDVLDVVISKPPLHSTSSSTKRQRFKL